MTEAAVEGIACSRCGQSYPPFVPAPGVRYLCATCDGPVLDGPSHGVLPTTAYAYPAATPRRPPADPPASRTVGRYQIRAELGRGGMGVVYRALDPDLGREVAVKVLLAAEHSSRQHVHRFLREARAAARTEHPNLVRVHDLGSEGGLAWFTMELVGGPSLAQVLETRRTLPPAEVARVGALLARALAAAHDRGLIHRDVKPGNVLFRNDGTPLLADFGLATQIGETRLTKNGLIMGTPAYLSPEQTRGELTPASDQYALGAVLYEALAGRTPYDGEGSPHEIVWAIAERPPPSLAEVAPRLPAPLALVVETAIARDPTERYPTCLHLAEDLERWSRGEPIEARRPTFWRRAEAALRRRQTRLLLGATAIGVSVLVLQAWGTARGVWERDAAEHREVAAERALLGTTREVAARAAALDVDGGRDLLLELARGPQYVGTAAASRAWLAAAQVLSEHGRGAETLELWAAGWAAARDPVDQDAALRGLEREFRAEWRFPSLLRVLERHEATSPAAEGDPLHAALRADALLWLRDLEAAAGWRERAGLEGAAIARHLSVARSVALEPQGRVLDGDGDGAPEWWGLRRSDGTLVSTRLVPGLPSEELGRLEPLGPEPILRVVAGEPPVVLVWTDVDGGRLRVLEARDQGLVEVHAAPTSAPLDALRLDDGSIGVALGAPDRRLGRLSRRGTGWTHELASPAIDTAGSDVTALALADLDLDGSRELVVARGAWTAYDLTAWAGLPDAAEALPLARRKVGSVQELAVLPGSPERIWALHTEAAPSAVVFPRDAPTGEPAGVYLLALGGGELVTERFLPTPGPSGVPRLTRDLVVADLDGDGALDLAYGLSVDEREVLVIHPGAEEGPPLVIADLSPLAAAQLDEDPALELLALLWAGAGQRPTTVVLGLGEEPLAPASRPADARSVPGELGAGARPTWARAEDLVSVGLPEAGAQALGRLADAWRGHPDGVLARRREAELLADDPERAGALLEQAVADGGDTPDRIGAAEAWLRAHRFDEAERVLAPVVAQSEAARELLATFADELSHSRRSALGAGPLPAEVVVGDPLGLSRDPEGTLRLAGLSGGPAALSVPFELTGGRLGFSAVVDLERVERGSGVTIELVGPGGERISAWVRAFGGGGLLEREVGCRVRDEEGVVLRVPVDGAAEPSRVVLEADLSEALGGWRCAVRAGERTAAGSGRLSEPLARGPWTWALGPPRPDRSDPRGQVVALLRSVDLVGTLAPARPTDDQERARRWFAGELPSSAPPGFEMHHAAALADLGRTEEAVAALRALPASSRGADAARAAEILRTRIATFGPVLREAWGDDWIGVFDQAFAAAMLAHGSDEEVRLALTTGLTGLESALTHLRGEDRARAAALLLARGRAWSGLGQSGAALRDLQQATEALLPTLEGAEGGPALRFALATAWMDHAVVVATRGDAASARDAVRRAREVAWPPELADDLLAARPALRTLAP